MIRASSLIAPSSCGVAMILRDDRFGLDQRIVVRIVLEEELDHARHEDRAARNARAAPHERAGRHAANHDLERNHLRAPHEHLVVVVVFAAADVVRRHAAQVQQPEDARGRLGGDAALAFDLVAPRAVAGGDRVHLLHDEQIRLPFGLEENLRLAARDLASFFHGSLLSDRGADALRRAGARAPAHRRRGCAGSSCERTSAGSTKRTMRSSPASSCESGFVSPRSSAS